MWSMDAALRDEATELPADLIRIDTANPPGNETPAAVLLQWYLEREGVECELVARDPERANLIARMRGSGDGPVARAARPHRRRVRRPADWSVAAVRRRRARRLPVGTRRARHEVADRVQRASRSRVLARSGFRSRTAIVLLIAEADEEDGVDERRHPLARGASARTCARLRAQRGELTASCSRTGAIVHAVRAPREDDHARARARARRAPGHASCPTLGGQRAAQARSRARAPRRVRPVRRQPELDALLDVLVPGNDSIEERIERGRAQHAELCAILRRSPAPRSSPRWRARRASAT